MGGVPYRDTLDFSSPEPCTTSEVSAENTMTRISLRGSTVSTHRSLADDNGAMVNVAPFVEQRLEIVADFGLLGDL